ncbi:hypothetical protein LCGC14_3006570, partial [marine sediment metagenome]
AMPSRRWETVMGSNAVLIAELEQAKEGSRALSDRVLLALGYSLKTRTLEWYTPAGVVIGHNSDWSRRPDPSRNLQCAVDLVPEGHPWTLDSIGIVEMGTTTGKPVEGIAATRAIAMCIAILKAMEAGDG